MSGWLDDLAEALGVDPLTNEEIGQLLPAAREVAHRVERKDTPLATFLLGLATGQRVGAGTARPEASRAAVETALASLPEEPPPAG